ncbi:MAG TPA: hypothetical protein VG711_08265, partial [Phycisphaerales bacterium]|nr:hypothetical protein [Phycisphaerales bacterium]
RCLLFSVLIHSVVMFLMTFWQVTAGVNELLGQKRDLQVALAGMELHDSIAQQVLGLLSEAPLVDAAEPKLMAKADINDVSEKPATLEVSSSTPTDAPQQVEPSLQTEMVARANADESPDQWKEDAPASTLTMQKSELRETNAATPESVQVQLTAENQAQATPAQARQANRAENQLAESEIQPVVTKIPQSTEPTRSDVQVTAANVTKAQPAEGSAPQQAIPVHVPTAKVDVPVLAELPTPVTPSSVRESADASTEIAMKPVSVTNAPDAGYAGASLPAAVDVAVAVPAKSVMDAPRESQVAIPTAKTDMSAVVPKVGDSLVATNEINVPKSIDIPGIAPDDHREFSLPHSATTPAASQPENAERAIASERPSLETPNAARTNTGKVAAELTAVAMIGVQLPAQMPEAHPAPQHAGAKESIRESHPTLPDAKAPAMKTQGLEPAAEPLLLAVSVPIEKNEIKTGTMKEQPAHTQVALETAPDAGRTQASGPRLRADRDAPTVELHQPMPALASVEVPLSLPTKGRTAGEPKREQQKAMDTAQAPRRDSPELVAMLEPMNADVKIPKVEMPPVNAYVNRTPERRETVLKEMGGSEETERAVKLALQWLAEHQSPDGRWDSDHFDDDCGKCGNPSSFDADNAVTGMAMLCFLASDHTHLREGPYQQIVKRAMDWLISRQRDTGDLRGGESMYSHGIATIALAELFAMTKDEKLKDPVEKAVGFIVRALNTTEGGWRYEPQQPGDTSVMGWQVMALTSAKRAGIHVPEEVLEAAKDWMEAVSAPQYPGLYSYQPGQVPSVAMTAEAMFALELLGVPRDDARMKGSAEFVARSLPKWNNDPNTYYWYYATLALFQYQGEQWDKWNTAITRQLVDHQVRDGKPAGSWDPVDKWSRIGGRLYQTCVCTLSLEVYYRYLPMYIVDSRKTDANPVGMNVNTGGAAADVSQGMN